MKVATPVGIVPGKRSEPMAVSSPLWKRLQLLVSVLSVLALLLVAGLSWFWWQMRGSLPALTGERNLSGLTAPTTIEHDALGVPTISGTNRLDVARATGYVHAQDRFFQMDLLRRSGAGELAEIFGSAAVSLDQAHRLHGFRATAEKAFVLLTPEKRQLLEAYTVGVNAGLSDLKKSPWEYLVLRTTPQPWRSEDSLLVAYAMWFDLQDSTGRFERSLDALRLSRGMSVMDFLAPRGTSWDAALDGSTTPAEPLPPIQFKPAHAQPTARLDFSEALFPGSNSFAVSGAHTASGAALLANDMHLNLNVPNLWYRAVLRWTDAAGQARRLVGVTLPGTPGLVAGSNGSIAWGFTNSNLDSIDVVTVELDPIGDIYYRTPEGRREFEVRQEFIKVKGEDPVAFTARWTEWGPVISPVANGRCHAIRWNAHDPNATNFDLLDLENAPNVAAAVAISHRVGMPNQNLLVADTTGQIAWTLTGKIPRRVGYDGRIPVSWAFGDRKWDGWLNPEEIPVILNPSEGLLSTANQRLVGGDNGAKLGDGGYDVGARGQQLRDDLRRLITTSDKAVAPSDLLAIQLDDRALFLERWQQLFLQQLTDEVVAENAPRAALRTAVRQWNGRASIDSAAYRLVRTFRFRVAELALSPFLERARVTYPRFNHLNFQYEDALWQLATEQPANLLNPAYPSWNTLLLAAVDEVIAATDQAGVKPLEFFWGDHNKLRMQHPFSRFLPGIFSRLLNMPAQPLPGGADMPRVQGPGHGASEQLVVSPGREDEGIFHMPGGQSGHPLSPFYRAGHDAWVKGEPTPLLPGLTQHTLTLTP